MCFDVKRKPHLIFYYPEHFLGGAHLKTATRSKISYTWVIRTFSTNPGTQQSSESVGCDSLGSGTRAATLDNSMPGGTTN